MQRKLHSLTVSQIVCLSAVALTLLWIWIHSLIPRTASAEESGRVAAFLASLFPTDTALGSFLYTNVRKIAHFAEYAVLGAELAVATRLFEIPCRRCLTLAFFGLCVGFADETLQIFSGRGPAVTDVWIDCAGYLFLYLPLTLLLRLAARNDQKSR